MKNILSVMLMILFTSSINAQGAFEVGDPNTTNLPNYSMFLGSDTIQFTEGEQKILLTNQLGELIVTVKKGEIVSIERLNGEGRYMLESADEGTQRMDCKCGYNCWEDEIMLQSICICKSCDGSEGNYKGFLKVEAMDGYGVTD